MRVVAVYVGSAGVGNLRVGIDAGVWGFKKDQDTYRRIEPGDVLVLARGFDGGSPRTGDAEWLRASVAAIEVGRVTSHVHVDRSPVWPDEESGQTSYPYRFTFEHLGSFGPTALGPAGPVGSAVTLGFRLSAIVQGRGEVIEDPGGFDAAHFGLTTGAESADVDWDDAAANVDVTVVTPEDLLDAFRTELDRAGLVFPAHLPLRFLGGLLAKPFVILAGLSGSGKTQLASALGRWLGEDRILVAAVRPDWTGSEALFGYENLLLQPDAAGRAAWSVPPVLQFLLTAATAPDEPHLLVLDEMNLAHVERYFADALSGMESGTPVVPNLEPGADGAWRVSDPEMPRLPWPANVLVVGTVNVDETTYQFSPKVLDRSTTIEFRTETAALAAEPPSPEAIRTASVAMRRRFVDRFDDLPTTVADPLDKAIQDLHRLLGVHGREFGHRTYQEMRRYAAITQAAADVPDDEVLDHLVLQKVLPRINGSARELAPVLDALAAITAGDGAGGESDAEGSTAALPLSADKLARMRAELDATHFTSF